MRLLNTKTLLLETFTEGTGGSSTLFPPFAILSHTWEDEEVTFQDLQGDQSLLRQKLFLRK